MFKIIKNLKEGINPKTEILWKTTCRFEKEPSTTSRNRKKRINWIVDRPSRRNSEGEDVI